MDRRFDEVLEKVKTGNRFMVVSHVNPEGDAIGSLLGLTLALKSLGKEVTPYLEDDVPDLFRFLPGADTIVHSLSDNGPFDATFAVDCGKKDRLGKGFLDLSEPSTIINIDHHVSNDRFGDINVIVPDASATGEIIFDFCRALSIKITREIAINLYVAIHTDTGSFRYSSSTSESFMKAGELVKLGADPWEISRRVYENHPVKRYRLLAMVLATLDVINASDGDEAGNIATLTVTQEMLQKSEAEKDLADGFVNYARGISGVEVGILFRETGTDEYKVSLRSKGDIDVADIAQSFGGGGHIHAAGCNMKGNFEEIRSRVVEAVKAVVVASQSV